MSKGYNIQVLGKPALLLAVVLLSCQMMLSAQMTVSIGNQLHCENSEVMVPVSVTGFVDVAAFTLYISTDTLQAEYLEVVSPNAQLAGGMIIANFVPELSTIILTWQSMSAANIPEGILFELKMYFHPGVATLDFLDNCEIVLSDLSVVQDVTYVKGVLLEAIQIEQQPQDVSVTEGEQAAFEVVLLLTGDHDYQWQCNDGSGWTDLSETLNYSGVKTAQLTISNVPASFNSNDYRCLIAFDDCSEYSDSALLTVTPSSVDVASPADGSVGLHVFPNPCNDLLKYSFSRRQEESRLQLIGLTGEVLIDAEARYPSGNIPLEDVLPGIYFLQCTRNDGTRETVKVVKQ